MVHGSRADRGGDRERRRQGTVLCLLLSPWGKGDREPSPVSSVSSLTDCSAFFQKSAVLRESRTDGHDGVFQRRIRL